MAKKRELTVSMLREAAEKARRLQALSKPVKYYKCEIKNLPLFDELVKAGKLRQTKSGSWDVVDG